MIGRRKFLSTMAKAALAVVAAPAALTASEPTSLGITRLTA